MNPILHHDDQTGWVRGALIMQPHTCAQLSHLLHSQAQELWELTTETDYATMWQGARDAASRILAATDVEHVKQEQRRAAPIANLAPELSDLLCIMASALVSYHGQQLPIPPLWPGATEPKPKPDPGGER